jgi:hypothetical protein
MVIDKMYTHKSGFLHENRPIEWQSTTIGRAVWPKIHRLRDNAGEVVPLKACVSACEGSARADVAPTLRSAFSVSARRADLKVGATKHRGSPLCTRNKRELAMISENREKIYIIETKIVSSFCVAG